MFYDLMSTLIRRLGRLRGEWLRFKIQLFGGQCGEKLWVGKGVIFKHGLHSKLKIGHDVRIGEYSIIDVPAYGELNIGNNVTLSMGCVIASQSVVKIGDNSLVGEYTSIRDADHGILLGSLIRTQEMHPNPVHIAEDVWIGRGCAILKGVILSTGCVVGANSVVTKSVEPNAVVVGAPARKISIRKK